MFSYQVSSYNGSVGTLDLFLEPVSSSINGLQLILSLNSDQPLQIIDQNPQKEGIQLDISSRPDFTFLTNSVTLEPPSYKIVLAAITSNPQNPVAITKSTLIGRLHFSGQNLAQFTITSDNQKTKLAINGQEQSTLSSDSPVSLSVDQNKLAQATPAPLSGQMYDLDTHKAQLQVTTTPSSQAGVTLSPSLVSHSPLSFFQSSNLYVYPLLILTCFLLAITIFLLIKQRRRQ